jgi:cardiolipin synthase
MNALSEAVARFAIEIHPDRIHAICSALNSGEDSRIIPIVKNNLGSGAPSRLMEDLAAALQSYPRTSARELSAMLEAGSATAVLASGASSVELVWTGPATGLVPIRHTEQVLAGLIDEARDRIFLVSFVAYDVKNVINALQRAVERRVLIRVLVERSEKHGGNVSVDSFAALKRCVPDALLYEWKKSLTLKEPGASVHAKCAVADGKVAFITSANLSDAAMERNMELGVLLRGGQMPQLLDQHLMALIATNQVGIGV